MKKIINLTILIVILFITFCVEISAESEINCTTDIYGNRVIISGTISDAKEKYYLSLLVRNGRKIIYLDQTQSDINGNFQISFPMSKDKEFTKYTYAIKTSGPHSTYYGEFDYFEEEPGKIDREFFDADLTISTNNFVPQIVGTVTCAQGKALTLKIQNYTEDETIVEKSISSDGGTFDISVSLPSLLNINRYIVTILCYDESRTLATANFEINSSIAFVTIQGDINADDGVRIDTRMQTNTTEAVDKSLRFTGSKGVYLPLPNIMQNMSYHFMATGTEEISSPVYSGEIIASTTNRIKGKKYDTQIININLASRTDLNDKHFRLKYNYTKVNVVNISELYFQNRINVVYSVPGEILFTVDEATDRNGNVKNGVIGLFRCNFIENATDGTDICLEIIG